MKSFEIDFANQRWDAYRAFHKTNGPFVEFADGSLMLNTEPNIDYRKHYEKYDIEVFSSADGYRHEMYLDKEKQEPVVKAWMNTAGQQVLAVDHEQKVVVNIGSPSLKQVAVTDNKYGCRVHWAGHSRLPVPSSPVLVSRPDSELRKSLGPKLDAVTSAVTAALRIKVGGEKHVGWGESGSLSISPTWEDMPVEDIVAWVLDPNVPPYSNRAWRCANKGFDTPRRLTTHQYLYI